MNSIAMIISPLQNDWTQARADWTKANPAAVRDPSCREADANQDFRDRGGSLQIDARRDKRLLSGRRIGFPIAPTKTASGYGRAFDDLQTWASSAVSLHCELGRGVRGCRQFPPDRNSSRLSAARWLSCATAASQN